MNTQTEPVTAEQVQDAKDAVNAAMRKAHRLSELYDEQVTIPRMRENVGRCFRYRNTYSRGEGWWVFTRIIDVVGSCYRVLNISRGSDGQIQIVTNTHNRDQGTHPLGDNYTQISEQVYREAVAPILAAVLNWATPR